MTKVESYIEEQVRPSLRGGETIIAMAYMTTPMHGGVVAALRAKGYLCALTPQRLFVMQTTGLGAFKPILKHTGVTIHERSDIAAVTKVGGLRVSFEDGGELLLSGDTSLKHSKSQREFIDTLVSDHGSGEVAKEITRRDRKSSIIGLGIGLAIAGAILWYNYGYGAGRAEVSVQCDPSDDGIVCTATHTEGRADASACWDVVLVCDNGVRVTAHACEDVAPEQSARHTLTDDDFDGLSRCDVASSLLLENLEVEAK